MRHKLSHDAIRAFAHAGQYSQCTNGWRGGASPFDTILSRIFLDNAYTAAAPVPRCVPLVLEGPNGDHEVVGRVCTRPGGKPTLCPPSAGALCPSRGTPLEKDPSSSSPSLALPLPLPLVPTGGTCTGGCPGTAAVSVAGAGAGAGAGHGAAAGAGSPLLPALALSVTAVDGGAIAAGAGCGDCGLMAGGVSAAAAAAVALLGGDAPDACVTPVPGAAPPCAAGGLAAAVLPAAGGARCATCAGGPAQA